MITNYELFAMLLLVVVVVAFAVWMATMEVDAPALGKSPEQICYEAYRDESQGYRPAWDCLPLSEQMAWKAAAAAVAGFTTEAQRGTEEAEEAEEAVIPPHHTGHEARV